VPDGYAMVMATGIVSIAAEDQHDPALGLPLGVLASAVFVLVTVAAVELFWRNRDRSACSLCQPDRVLRWFSLVAACAVLAARWRTGPTPVVYALSGAAAAAWAVLTVPVLITLCSRSITQLRENARGAWLLASVACQSLAITAADLAGGAATRRPMLDMALACWLLGLVSYLTLTTLIIARAVSDRRLPVGPDAWILMGAVSIATLAAATITAAGGAPLRDWTATLTRPAAVVLWTLASAWIPVLLAAQARYLLLALWSHSARWAAVFPLGMYSVATSSLAGQFHLAALRCIALAASWIALTACAVASAGMSRSSRSCRITI
jgi:tellurite resistance protein TehA-like permease